MGVDHLIQGYLGTLGRLGSQALSTGQDPDLVRRNLPKWARDIPIIRNGLAAITSVSPIGFGSEPVRRFYDLAQEVAEADRGANVQANNNDAVRWLDNHPEGRFAAEVREAKSALSDLADERQFVINSTRLTADKRDERLVWIDHRITEVAAMANELVEIGVERELERILREP